ncbi:MAG: adenylosuccinate synthase [Planctomycetes bacterium]|nr:adenylosuccinate synthase [Planctomycetota bacterium]
MEHPATEHACVFGLGWGDEGKGKIVDLLCPAFDYVVRFNGGANAGHTVVVDGQRFALHLLPTGVLHEGVVSVIGPGVVVDPVKLLAEIDALAARGIDVRPRLRISERAHLVLAYHQLEDQLSEKAASDTARIGTTARGIGPCYADKMKRAPAIRFSDLLHDPGLTARVREIVTARCNALRGLYGSDGGLQAEDVLETVETARTRLADCITDTTALLHDGLAARRRILFEGANGVLLDVDHGTYPFVTSSSTGPHGIGSGAGVPPVRVPRLVGAIKAYATRVGAGPFVSELNDETGDRIRVCGHEFGTTTGRPRRCGWFDAVACRYSVRVSGATDVALLHLDTLGGFPEVGICTAYRCDGVTLTTPPADAARLLRAEPVIEFLPGWPAELRAVRRFEDLPPPAREYVRRIETLIEAPISIIGVGPDRAQTLVRGPLAEII